MTIFVLGSSGMLGRYVCSFLKTKCLNIKPIMRKDYTINDETIKKVGSLFDTYNMVPGDVIINCIGIIPQTNNTNIRDYILVNSLFPIKLSHLCSNMKIRFIHITTDCVFSGQTGCYSEDDDHDETSIYGVSKSLSDNCYETTIIRTSIIGEEFNNKYSLLEWVKSNANKRINGYINHYWNGITCFQLSKIIYSIINDNLYWNGVRHIFSPTSLTKYELILLINNVYDLHVDVSKHVDIITSNKTLRSLYDTNSIFCIPSIQEQIYEQKCYTETIE